MTNTVTLTIDDLQVTVPDGTLVVDAAKRIGIDIPVFCYHPKMEPVGMCRMCLVEVGRPQIDRETRQPVLDEHGSPVVQFGGKLETGCTVQVSEGMVVRGVTEKVQAGRNEILEFILTSHPLDCPICDKGGECPLQNLTMAHGPGTSRFLYDDKIQLAKHVPLGELIYLDRERCIQCARCTRFQDEVVGDPVIGFFNRGRSLEIVTFSDPGFDSIWSGNTTDICPVGALTTADFRFGARPWELNAAASICNQCPVGCNLTFNTRREAVSGGNFVIKRAMPRQNEAVNEIWICDKGRFTSYHFSESEDRLTQPLVRVNGELIPAEWGEALDIAAEKLGAARGSLLALAGGRLSNEDLFNMKSLSDHLDGQAVLDTHVAGGELVAAYGLAPGSNLGDLGPGDAVLVIACDLEQEAPLWWLRVKQAAERGATVVVANPRLTKLDRSASHHISYTYGQEISALERLPEAFTKARDRVVFFGAEGLGLAGSARLAKALAELVSGFERTGMPNNGLVAVHPHPNDQGAWELGFRPAADLAAAFSAAGAAYLAGSDPLGDGLVSEADLDGLDCLVVQDLFLTETAARADVVLPAQAYVERDGSYTSGERRVQRFFSAVPEPAGTRPDFTITAQIAMRLDLELEGRIAPRAFANLAAACPPYQGLTYMKLARVEEQFPIVGRGDMYYGGTTYENSQGLGVQLPLQEGVVNAWDAPAVQETVAGLSAVPITRLYDRGALASRSRTLAPRLDEVQVVLHPKDAAALDLSSGRKAAIQLNGGSGMEVEVALDPGIPQGYALVPRSMGVPVHRPVGASLRALEGELAA